MDTKDLAKKAGDIARKYAEKDKRDTKRRAKKLLDELGKVDPGKTRTWFGGKELK